MAEKVEVVITIPKYYLECPQDYSCLAECVRRGIVLPEGHGELIYRDDVTNFEGHYIITDAPTIIEADKGEE